MDSLNGAKFEVKEVRHGERVKKAPLPFTDFHIAAGSQQGIKFLYPEDYASGTAVI